MGSQPVLEIKNLTKTFGDTLAVDNLSLEIHRGEVLGLLGPNGAGKTTTIKMIFGLTPQTSGTILYDGQAAGKELRGSIGVCPQETVIWDLLTCIEQLTFQGEMYGLSAEESRRRGLRLLDALGLGERSGSQARTLSGGMKRRLNVALALIHDPEILILDEPEAGLDSQSRILVREFIRGLARSKTVLLTTHNMDEAERVADRVAIMDHGRLLALDTPDNLRRSLGGGDVVELGIPEGSEEPVRLLLPDWTVTAGRVTLRGGDSLRSLMEATDRLRQGRIETGEVRIRRSTLEDAFIKLTGRGLRE